MGRDMREAGTGFSRGFFGCLGSLAAIAVVVVAILSLGQCANEPEPATVSKVQVANTRENATYCTSGLEWARRAGEVDRESSALVFPWAITREGDRITCAITNRGEMTHIVVEARCADEENVLCASVVSVSGRSAQ